MSPEVSLLSEVWQLVKSHVHVKERLEVAESILQMFDEHVDLSELEIYKNEFDRLMKTAIISHYDLNADDDEDDEWE